MSLNLKSLAVSINDRPVVKDVSLSLDPGEVVALVGASGSGKSLTASALTGSLPGSARASGYLEVQGQGVLLATRIRPGVAAVRQDSLTALHPLVRIDRQLIPVLLRSGAAAIRAAAATRAASMLEEVGFADPRSVLRSFPMELSGGQRQRVCIVQALACRAAFLIADEPTTALDVVSQQLVLAALRRAAEAGAGILLITHDVAAAATLCSRAVVIDNGTVLDHGSFSHLAGSSAHVDARALMESARHSVARGRTATA
ncbi:ATP-binding cassette domain-containing protein [Arthrobacter sp. U41]|uniref:ATP-binding cassette domain-containing protein n=1 Tax=Arthrobacter sp. U41 TaxID=1849032 RepID=UPI001642D278|nr:ATP-binding cassette domain-containing protein [Arthrobacter sp. U41]